MLFCLQSPPSFHLSVFFCILLFFPSKLCPQCLVMFNNGKRSPGGSLCLVVVSVACSQLGAASPGAFPSLGPCLLWYCFLLGHTDLSLPLQMWLLFFCAKTLPLTPLISLLCYLVRVSRSRGTWGEKWWQALVQFWCTTVQTYRVVPSCAMGLPKFLYFQNVSQVVCRQVCLTVVPVAILLWLRDIISDIIICFFT